MDKQQMMMIKKLTDAPIKHNPLSQSLSGSVIQLRPDLELFIYTRNYMKECSLTISEAKDQRLLYDGPYTLPMFNWDIIFPCVVGDSFLDIEPLPELHVFPNPQALQPLQPHPDPPHPKQPLAETQASPWGHKTSSQCFSATESGKGDEPIA